MLYCPEFCDFDGNCEDCPRMTGEDRYIPHKNKGPSLLELDRDFEIPEYPGQSSNEIPYGW